MADERNLRITTLARNKMRYLFREVLTSVEKESKEFGVNSNFFSKSTGKPKGFYAIRKCLFDHGNELVETLELILNELETTPKKAIVQLSKKVVDECGTDTEN